MCQQSDDDRGCLAKGAEKSQEERKRDGNLLDLYGPTSCWLSSLLSRISFLLFFFFFFCFFFPYTTVSLDWRNDCSLYIHFRFLNPMALQPTRIAGLYRHAAHSSFSPSIFFSSSSILDPVGSIFHPSSFLYVYPFFGPEDPSSISHSLVHYYTTSSKQRLYIYTG